MVDRIKLFCEQDENTVYNATVLEDDKTGLCKEHYGAWYRHKNPHQYKCKTCEKIMTDISKTRACPEPKVITKL